MGKKSLPAFFCDQFTKVPPVAEADLKGKTVIVVGANTGLGFEAAQHFAKMDAGRLILACRSRERGEGALQRLKAGTGYSGAELWLVDLADFSSVTAFADRALKELERLDILLLNAAYAPSTDGKFNATKDGLESAIQINDVSGPLLSFLLLPLMTETAKKHDTTPRTVVVASEVHYWITLDKEVLETPNAIETLASEKFCTPSVLKNRYRDTKLLNVFFTRAFNRHLKDQSTIINCVNPGFCYSELTRNVSSIVFSAAQWVLARTSEQGGRQLVWAAVGVPEGGLDELRGAYINIQKVEEPSDFVVGEEGRKWEDKLWVDLISILKRVDPRVSKILAEYF